MEGNIRRAEALALDVWRLGYAALSPHCNTRFFQGAAPDEVWLNGDIEIMLRCDAVLTVPNWENSVGAKEEVAIAKLEAIPVFHSLNQLVQYFDKS